MAHYSEMDFLFNSTNRDQIVNKQLNVNSKNNIRNIFREDGDSGGYVVYKKKYNNGTNTIKEYLREQIYDSMKSNNPYIDILNHFNIASGKPGAGLKIKAADLAYLRDLGVYPINRMAILRRFPEGMFVPENLDEMEREPLSTVIGWIKPDQNFGTINFNETWTRTNERFDVALAEILKKSFKLDIGSLVPIPDFAQGLLFEFYKRAGLTTGAIEKEGVDETYEMYNQNKVTSDAIKALENQQKTYPNQNISTNTGTTSKETGDRDTWNTTNIPVGDPNVLQEGPFRDPLGQNIQSNFQFELETTYEQKLLGDVDPGSAMLDIIDNLYAMGTSNMVFYWGAESPIVTNAKNAVANKANNLNSWWIFVSQLMIQFWNTLKELFTDLKETVVKNATDFQTEAQKVMKNTEDTQKKIDEKQQVIDAANSVISNPSSSKADKDAYQKLLTDATAEKKQLEDSKSLNIATDAGKKAVDFMISTLETILTSTIAIHRFKLRGSLELMIGGSDSSTPWYLTIGNPYSPWLATNHIIIQSASIETSTEMGFNDQPQWIKAKFTCQFSRSLGKQELMRMFNNTFRRTYANPHTFTPMQSVNTNPIVKSTSTPSSTRALFGP